MRHGKLCLLVSPDGREGSISSRQNALLYGTLLKAGEALEYNITWLACGVPGCRLRKALSLLTE